MAVFNLFVDIKDTYLRKMCRKKPDRAPLKEVLGERYN